MEKSNLYRVDDFGVKNYNYGILALLSFALFAVINIGLGYITFIAEIEAVGSPVKNYADAFWLMVMSSTTIGLMLYKNIVDSQNGRTKHVEHLYLKA